MDGQVRITRAFYTSRYPLLLRRRCTDAGLSDSWPMPADKMRYLLIHLFTPGPAMPPTCPCAGRFCRRDRKLCFTAVARFLLFALEKRRGKGVGPLYLRRRADDARKPCFLICRAPGNFLPIFRARVEGSNISICNFPAISSFLLPGASSVTKKVIKYIIQWQLIKAPFISIYHHRIAHSICLHKLPRASL